MVRRGAEGVSSRLETWGLERQRDDKSQRTSSRVSAKSKPQRIRSALRDTLGKVLRLPRPGLGDLLVVQVSSLELLVQRVERASLHDIDRVDDVSERLGHLSAVGVSDHGMAVDLLEGHLAGQVDTEEDHSGDPEEEDVPSGLEQGGRVEVLDVLGLEVGRTKRACRSRNQRCASVLLGEGRGKIERTCLGQPMMAKGQRPDENQVSRTSSSWLRVNFLPLAIFSARSVASSSVRPTTQ
jgi:hypothetical protein